MSNTEVSTSVGQDIDRFEGRGVVGGPFDVNLNRELRSGFNHAGDGVQPVNMPRKDGWALCVKPQVIGEIERDEGRCLVIGIQDTVVVVVPVRGQFSVFRVVKVQIVASVIVVIVVNGVRPG